MSRPEESYSSRTGSANTPGTWKAASDGPMARTIIFFGAVPEIMKPPISALSPVSTRKRVERLRICVAGFDGVTAVGLVGGVVGAVEEMLVDAENSEVFPLESMAVALTVATFA